jgi:hypothetical protein
MEATESATPARGRAAGIALDFLRLAGASIIAGLLTAAIAAACVILLSSSTDAGVDPSETPTPPAATAVSMTSGVELE